MKRRRNKAEKARVKLNNPTGLMSCYGSHGSVPDCSDCQFADYCKDAQDIPLLEKQHRVMPMYDEEGRQTVDAAEQKKELDRLRVPIVSLLVRFVQKYNEDKRIGEMILSKMTHSDYPLSRIRRLFGFDSKQHAAYYFGLWAQDIPELNWLLVFDKRFKPKFKKKGA